tara:strand:- start:968 stop:1501 length:534 start_codon:yes stop_codon:yes gene_type:complete
MSSALERPYDLQTQRGWPDDNDIDEWLNSLEGPCLNILVGPRGCGKSQFIETSGLQVRGSQSGKKSTVDPLAELNIIDFDLFKSGMLTMSREMRDVRKGIKRRESFIFDYTNLTRLERNKILGMFPDVYHKVVIAWELSDEELRLRGCSSDQIEEAKINYERPHPDEDVDELVYIFS